MAKNSGCSFSGTRARLQRLSDAKFFAGWVRKLTEKELLVELAPDSECYVGDTFNVQAQGKDRTAVVTGMIVAMEDRQAAFEVMGRIQLINQTEMARFLVSDVTGEVFGEEGQTSVMIVDVCEGGAALTSPSSLKVGSDVELKIEIHETLVTLPALVRYCKADKADPSIYRVGLEMKSLNRIDHARWHTFVEEAMYA